MRSHFRAEFCALCHLILWRTERRVVSTQVTTSARKNTTNLIEILNQRHRQAKGGNRGIFGGKAGVREEVGVGGGKAGVREEVGVGGGKAGVREEVGVGGGKAGVREEVGVGGGKAGVREEVGGGKAEVEVGGVREEVGVGGGKAEVPEGNP